MMTESSTEIVGAIGAVLLLFVDHRNVFFFWCCLRSTKKSLISRIPCGLVDANVATSIQRWKNAVVFLLRFFCCTQKKCFVCWFIYYEYSENDMCMDIRPRRSHVCFFPQTFLQTSRERERREKTVEKLGLYFITFYLYTHGWLCINIVVLFIFAHLQQFFFRCRYFVGTQKRFFFVRTARLFDVG